MRIFTFVLITFLPMFVSAQLVHDYSPISSSGKIPDEFLSSSTAKYEIQKKGLKNIASNFERRTKDRFYLESNFYVDALMLSGKVLFNDPIGKYINLVADELLKEHPALRRQVRIYVVKSPVANAFATERGSIFINIGLIARLKNEAQLAFVLAHEIIHFTEGHVINNYVAAQYVNDEMGAYKQASRYEKMLAKSNYSQEQELAADKKGMELFMTSRYRASAAPSLMTVLKNARYPYANVLNPYPAFINQYFTKDTYNQLTNHGYESFDNSSTSSDFEKKAKLKNEKLSLHPSLQERQDRLQKILIKKGNQGYYFIRTKRQFQVCQEMARFELCQLFLEQTAYHDAFYQIHTLINQYPDEVYLQQNLAKLLYGLVKYRLAEKAFPNYLNYEYVHPNAKLLLHNIKSIRTEVFSMIALTYLWSSREKLPKTFVNHLVTDLIIEQLTFQDYGEEFDFAAKWIAQSWITLKEDKDFSSIYTLAKEKYTTSRDQLVFEKTREGQKQLHKAKKQLQQKGYKLGVDTLVIFGPVYYRIDKRQKHDNPIQHVASEQQQAELYDLIRQAARKLDIKLYLLDSRSLKARDPASHFNDIAKLYAWHEEWLRHGEMDIICSNYDQVLPLVERYGTPYFAHMGAISMRANFTYKKLLVAIPTLAAPPVWPVFAYLALRPNEASFFYTWVYDLGSHERVMNKYNRMKMKTNETVLKSNIYYDLWQIQRKSK